MPRKRTTARAHPNIALLKYWGKQRRPGNFPAVPSLSVTIDGLATQTTVAEAKQDSVALNGKTTQDQRIQRLLADWRRRHEIPPLAISSCNNFPTAAGLASSASGFAALVTAVDAHCGLGLTAEQRAEAARRGSASAARSIHGGFVALAAPGWCAEPLLNADDWPLQVVVAIASTAAKAVSSTEGMAISRRTSPFYQAWVAASERDYPAMRAAVLGRDFNRLARLAEASCLRMHGLMMGGEPALIYWNAATLNCIEAIRKARQDGLNVFFTVDAGPQIKAVCEADCAEEVQNLLSRQQGVLRTMIVGLGGGAAVVQG